MAVCYFRKEWMVNPEFSWLREVDGNRRMAFCSACNVSFNLSNMGFTAIKSHQKGKKHKRRLKNAQASVQNMFSKSQSFEKNKCPVTNSPANQQSTECSDSIASHSSSPAGKDKFISKSIQKYMLKDSVANSEILWCLETVMTHKSLRSAENDAKLFSQLFPDSNIAKEMQLGKSKMAYTLVYGIAPFFKDNLIEEILSCSHFVLGFDESLNKIAQKQQMDINVRFWSSESNQVETRYINSAFLGRSCSSDLSESFISAVHPLNLKKLFQLSMDGPNVNKKFFRDLSCSLKETPEDPEVLNLGSCGLHAVNVAFKAGIIATGWHVMEFNRSLYYLFKDSPARRALYTNYTKSKKFPLKFCYVRWLQNSCVAERALSMLPNLKTFIENIEKDKVVPSSKSYKIVKDNMLDKLLPAKLAFFQLIAEELECFLKEYQTDSPLIPFLYTDLSSLIQRLLLRFIKKEEITKNVMEVDLNDESIYLPLKKIDVGISTQCTLRKLKMPDDKLLEFKNDCKKFLQKSVMKLQEFSPLMYQMTKAVSCFDPRISINENLFSSRLTKLLIILTEKNWISASTADQVKTQLTQLCLDPDVLQKLKSYKRPLRIDNFWYDLLKGENTKDSMSVMKMIMILSHGNSNIERGFSINKECLLENMKEESLVARRIIYDSILAEGGLKNFKINKKLILRVRNSRALYTEAIERKKKELQKLSETRKLKRKADKELQELREKKVKLLEDAHKESQKIDEKIAALNLLKKAK